MPVLAGAHRRADQNAPRHDRVAVAASLRRSHHHAAVSAQHQVADLMHGQSPPTGQEAPVTVARLVDELARHLVVGNL
jgi:hypothetical protein